MTDRLTPAQLDALRWIADCSTSGGPLFQTDDEETRKQGHRQWRLLPTPRRTTLATLLNQGLIATEPRSRSAGDTIELTDDGVDALRRQGFDWRSLRAWLRWVGPESRNRLRDELADVEAELAEQEIRDTIRKVLRGAGVHDNTVAVIFTASEYDGKNILHPFGDAHQADGTVEWLDFGHEMQVMLIEAFGLPVGDLAAVGFRLRDGKLHFAEAGLTLDELMAVAR